MTKHLNNCIVQYMLINIIYIVYYLSTGSFFPPAQNLVYHDVPVVAKLQIAAI